MNRGRGIEVEEINVSKILLEVSFNDIATILNEFWGSKKRPVIAVNISLK